MPFTHSLVMPISTTAQIQELFFYIHKTYRIHLVLLIFISVWGWALGIGQPISDLIYGENWSSFSHQPSIPCSCSFTNYLLLVGLWEAVDMSLLLWKAIQLLEVCSNSHSETHKKWSGIGCCSPQRRVENYNRTRGSSAVEIVKAFWHSFNAERKLCMKETGVKRQDSILGKKGRLNMTWRVCYCRARLHARAIAGICRHRQMFSLYELCVHHFFPSTHNIFMT